MSAKLIPGLLVLLFSANAVYAAVPAEPAKTAHQAARTPTDPAATIKQFRDEYKKTYDDMTKANKDKEVKSSDVLNKMSAASKYAFGRAVKYYNDKTPGLSTNSLMRLMMSPESEHMPVDLMLKKAQQLGEVVKNGTPEQREAAQLQLEMMDLAGIRLEGNNMNSKEFDALRILMSIDLQAMPHAIPVVKRVTKNLRDGSKSVEESVKDGMTGMKGSLEDFIANCGKGQGAVALFK
jgi:hypothetical protein